jgi:hypothetical protein
MEVGHESDRDLYFLTGIHLTFVASTLILALADWLGHAKASEAHGGTGE